MQNIGYLMIKMRAKEIHSEKYRLFIDIGYSLTEMKEGGYHPKAYIYIYSHFLIHHGVNDRPCFYVGCLGKQHLSKDAYI